MARRQTGGRIRAALFLAVSLGAAGVASLVIYTVIANFQRELETASAPEQTVPVMVASANLPQGRTLTTEDLALEHLPPHYVPDSVLRHPEQVVGRVPRERILQGEFIREERLADPQAGMGLNAIIPRGMRALSINITDGSAVSGFLNPGNYVDVLVTIQADGAREAETRTLFQAVTVLAVDARLGEGQRAADQARPSVTLAVTPDHAEQLTHANEEGSVVLTLRNDIDVTHVEAHGERAQTLLGGATDDLRIEVTEWKERSAQSRDGSLLIIKGGKSSRETVRLSN